MQVENELSISGTEVQENDKKFKPIKNQGIMVNLENEVKWVDTDSLKISDLHYEIYTMEDQIDEALLKSITSFGVVSPLIVDKDNYVISGTTRLKVAKILGLEKIPVIYNNQDFCSETMVTYNLNRIKKYYEIYKEYQILKRVLNISQGVRSDLKGKDKKSIPTILGVSPATLYRLVKIDKLSKELFGEDTEEIKKVWEMVETPKKGINPTLKYLTNLKNERLNTNGKVENVIGEGYRIYNTSSALMAELESNSVDLHMTSPPYWGGIRDYNLGANELGWESTVEEYVANLTEHFEATRRVLKDTGSLVVNLGDTYDKTKNQYVLAPNRFAVKMIDKGWHLVGSYIWIKSNFRPTPSKNRPTNIYEFIFHFSKTPNYAFYKDWMSEEKNPIFNPIIYGKTPKSFGIKDAFDFRNETKDGVIKWCVSRTIALEKKCSENGVEQNHNATFPLVIPAAFINLTTKPNDLVIDGFNGTASTGAACKVLGRNYVGFELNKNYLEVSKVRMNTVEGELKSKMVA